MIHPNAELRFINAAIGHGVFATQPIPQGTITWVRCAFDRTLTPTQVRALDSFYAPIVDKYAYVDGKGDAVLCWDHARFMNHSCNPSVLSPGFDFDVAIRDIASGEELTCDYGMLNLDASFPCSCGVAQCRRSVEPTDWQRFARAWDEKLRAVFPLVAKREQPLWALVQSKEQVLACAAQPSELPSCRVHCFAAND